MTKLVAEVDAEIAAAKAAGEAPMGAKLRKLRAERVIAAGYEAGTHNSDGTLRKVLTDADAAADLAGTPRPDNPSSPASATETSNPLPSEPAPLCASNDITFINEALAQLVLKGGAGKPEKAYSDLRSVLSIKHILEDAAGLTPSGRIALPHWDTLGRERDTGLPFKPGENQAIVDGLMQRAVPAPKNAPAAQRPTITTPDGQPIRLPRTRLDEPEGAATFVTAGESAE